jgi:hypothetical protein
VASIAAAVENDWRITTPELATMHNLPFGTVHTNFNDDLNLVKKSTHWVPKLLSTAQKQERVE